MLPEPRADGRHGGEDLRMPDEPRVSVEILRQLTPLRSGRGLERLEAFGPEVDPASLDWFVESGDLQDWCARLSEEWRE